MARVTPRKIFPLARQAPSADLPSDRQVVIYLSKGNTLYDGWRGLSGAHGAPHRWCYYYCCRLTAYEAISRDGTPPLVTTGVRSPCGGNGAAFLRPGHSINWICRAHVASLGMPSASSPMTKPERMCRVVSVDAAGRAARLPRAACWQPTCGAMLLPPPPPDLILTKRKGQMQSPHWAGLSAGRVISSSSCPYFMNHYYIYTLCCILGGGAT
jgi:hypothetical protein